ncbi:saccharopine dehydrogenase NADP-binding domain-containing protein [Streptomyces sp. 8N114]|uniref:saccharopine dehydrogenase NADP-binding domain-containing protein n=1 Tax=Streptomyces sp. 8N114 TaxID=3457419 RepID=UPI003FD2C023
MIGVLGGYGDVGRHAARTLHRAGQPLRIGGRSARSAAHFADRHLEGAAEHRAVDARDPESVRAFAAGLGVLVNCAGPSYATGVVAADAARETGCDYVDAAGDDALYARLSTGRYQRAGRSAVLSAGLRPGLTGLFPRAVAARVRDAGLSRVRALAMYTQVIDRFTRVAALEYLYGAAEGVARPLAAWRDGAPRARQLTRRQSAGLPFFPGACLLLPQLGTEDERTARTLGLERGDWWTVVAGEHTPAAFDRVHTLPREEVADLLCRASQLDLTGRRPSVTLAVVVEGDGPQGPAARTAVLNGPGNALLSGAVAALSALAVLDGSVPPGRHYAADVLDPEGVLQALSGVGRPAAATDGTPAARIELLPADVNPFRRDAVLEEGAL